MAAITRGEQPTVFSLKSSRSLPLRPAVGGELHNGVTWVNRDGETGLVVPPAEGYGKKGNSQAGIQGTDTLVFVVDIIDAA